MMNARSWFEGRRLVIATMHGKEEVLAPLLAEAFGWEVLLEPDLDTDLVGTCSGEIARKSDPLRVARQKCQMAMDLSGCDLALASEGSFGPHPTMFFVHADEELLLLLDSKNGFEIMVSELSTATNFNGSDIDSEDSLLGFAERAGFPGHGLILRAGKDSLQGLRKGVVDQQELLEHYRWLIQEFGSCYVETDMRAMYNPTRMLVIEAAGKKLAKRMDCLCAACKYPGFGKVSYRSGLPCRDCGRATRSTLVRLLSCVHCSHTEEQLYPNGKSTEDPMYCDYCNP